MEAVIADGASGDAETTMFFAPEVEFESERTIVIVHVSDIRARPGLGENLLSCRQAKLMDYLLSALSTCKSTSQAIANAFNLMNAQLKPQVDSECPQLFWRAQYCSLVVILDHARCQVYVAGSAEAQVVLSRGGHDKPLNRRDVDTRVRFGRRGHKMEHFPHIEVLGFFHKERLTRNDSHLSILSRHIRLHLGAEFTSILQTRIDAYGLEGACRDIVGDLVENDRVLIVIPLQDLVERKLAERSIREVHGELYGHEEAEADEEDGKLYHGQGMDGYDTDADSCPSDNDGYGDFEPDDCDDDDDDDDGDGYLRGETRDRSIWLPLCDGRPQQPPPLACCCPGAGWRLPSVRIISRSKVVCAIGACKLVICKLESKSDDASEEDCKESRERALLSQFDHGESECRWVDISLAEAETQTHEQQTWQLVYRSTPSRNKLKRVGLFTGLEERPTIAIQAAQEAAHDFDEVWFVIHHDLWRSWVAATNHLVYWTGERKALERAKRLAARAAELARIEEVRAAEQEKEKAKLAKGKGKKSKKR